MFSFTATLDLPGISHPASIMPYASTLSVFRNGLDISPMPLMLRWHVLTLGLHLHIAHSVGTCYVTQS